jgi:predicted  nucleic acid-binding Zn-ribbon protein
MTPQTRTSLKELQNLDQEIAAARSATQSFDPLLEEVDAPVLRLEQEVQALEKRLTELKLEENRIELTIEERRLRAAKLQERMGAVRNVREEAAVDAELEMVRRALESEEQEALSLLDQIRRLEERSEEQEAAYQEALAEAGPRRKELVKEQEATESKLEALQTERDAFAAGIDPGERRIYDSIMAGARDVAVSELTQDGACGNCFNMVPLQIQNQIRHGEGMFRCEGCGVILTPESAEGLAHAQEEGERIERALKASTDQRDEERAAVSEAVAREEAEEAAAAEKVAAEASGPAPDDLAPEVGSESVDDVATVEGATDEEATEGATSISDTSDTSDTSDDVPDEEQAVEDVASDDVPDEEQTVEEVTSDDVPADDQTVKDVASDDVPDEEQTVEEVTSDDVPADDQAVEDVASDDVPDEEQTVEEVASDDVPDEEQTVEEVASDDVPDEEQAIEGAEPRDPTADA